MATTSEAAAIISRGNDPQGNGFGIAAVASYSFIGGKFAYTADQKEAVSVAMKAWSDVARITFFVDNEDPEIGFENYRGGPDSAGHTAGENAIRNGEDFLILNPDTTVRLGWNLNVTGANALGQGRKDLKTLIHEMGHAIGLEHPGLYNGDDVPVVAGYYEDSRQYSIMSYLKEKTTGANFHGDYMRTPGLHDIAAAQRLYGANMTTRTDGTVYGFDSNAGPAFMITKADESPVFTVWDAGGDDTLNFSGFVDYNQFINLAPEGFSDVGGCEKNIALAAAVDTSGRNSWDPNFNPNAIANYIENAIGGGAMDTIYGNAIANRLEGRDGDDILFGFEGDDSLWGGNNDDTLHGGDQNDTLRGENGDDTINGGWGIDDLYGGEGDDILDGGDDGSRELMQGEAGNDTYFVWDAMDAISERVGGIDLDDKVLTTLNTYSLQQSNYIQGEVEDLEFIGTGNFKATGSELGNEIIGGDGNDTISGREGRDYLQGKGGNDTLDGGTAYDTLTGGSEDDVYFLFDVNVFRGYDRVIERAGGGLDQIQVRDTGGSTRSYTMTSNVEVGAIVGAEADQFTLIGNDSDNRLFDDIGDNILVGGAGDDTLNGGYFYGGDVLVGGEDDDTYILDLRRGNYNYVEEAADEGRDIVILTAFHEEDEHYTDAYTLTDNVEIGELRGAVDFDLYGNASHNTLYGNGMANLLSGLDGNDKLQGSLGDDVLVGGIGKDKYYLDDLTGGDRIVLTHYDAVVEELDGGIDTVFVRAIDNVQTFADGYTLTDNVENATVSGSLDFYLEGNELDNILTGNDAANTLYGLGGNDTLAGSEGVDRFDFASGERFGKDRITDFDARVEVLVLSTSAFTKTQNGNDTVLDFDNGDRITLDGIRAANLTDANFEIMA